MDLESATSLEVLLEPEAAKRDTTASKLIHAIVTVCTRWIRRIASGDATCNTEAIQVSIIAPWF